MSYKPETEKDLVSIIVPVYNVEDFLGECIKSILSQTYTNFELLLIDDGSRDRSWQVCKEYANTDCRLRIFKKENEGVTLARKKGWLESKGKWIMFVDSDDTITPNCLNLLLDKALNNDCDIVKGSMESSNGRRWIHQTTELLTQKQYLESLLMNQTYGYLCASIYKAEIFKETTFKIDPTIKIGEDVITCIELGLRIKKSLNINEVVYNYRYNAESVMNAKIMHPSYYERRYKVISLLLHNTEDFKKAEAYRKEQLKCDILNAFFSPMLPFDSKYYFKLKNVLKDHSSINKRDKILLAAMKNINLARTTKYSISFIYKLNNLIQKKPATSREIIY